MATVAGKRRRRSSPPCPEALTVVTDRVNLRIPESAFTHAGFRAWATSGDVPEHVRTAFIDGEVHLDMSNEEYETHILVKGEITRAIMNLNRERQLGKFYPDGGLVTNEAAGVSNNPDASFVTWEGIEAGRVQLVPREGEPGQYVEMVGTPDWVLEVVSRSSVQKDTTRLRQAYHRAGVPEYWLIDARGAEIVFQILYRRRTGYAAAPQRSGWQHSRVFGRGFRFVRRRDRAGLWEYTLEVQAD
jgi:Uma2 family endonuclease